MTSATPWLLGLGASLATSFGGLLALRCRRRLGMILALAAGVVLGVALLELIPEALDLARGRWSRAHVAGGVAGGFLVLLALDRGLARAGGRGSALRAHLAPASLTFHSLIDGAGIALAYRLAPEVGISVAFAVLGHDLADGANVVGAALPGGRRVARGWLMLNGAAPLAGVALATLVSVPPGVLVTLLAGLAGAFLYVGTSELLPRSYRLDRRPATPATSLLGFALVLLATRLA